jgi:hypothetical protein
MGDAAVNVAGAVPARTVRHIPRPARCDRIALLLQGGEAFDRQWPAAAGIAPGEDRRRPFPGRRHRVKYDAAADAMRALRHRVWIAMPPAQGVVVHDVHREDGCDAHGANAHD